MNSRFKPPSILASWLVNTRAFSVFMIVILVINAVIIGIDVECTLRWPNRLGWLHLTVDIISIVGESTGAFLHQELISKYQLYSTIGLLSDNYAQCINYYFFIWSPPAQSLL